MTTYDKIPEIIRMYKIITWRVFRRKSEKNSIVFASDPDKDVEANIADMDKFFSFDFGTYYVLDGSSKEGRAGSTYRFELDFSNVKDSTPPQQQQPTAYVGAAPTVINGYSEDDLRKQIEIVKREIDSEYKEKELQQMRKAFDEERREFERERNGALNVILSKIGAVLPAMFPTVQTQGITGSPEEEASHVIPAVDNVESMPEHDDDTTDEKQQQTAEPVDVFTEWCRLDPEAPQLLEKILSIAKTNPSLYQMAKNILKNN